MISQLHIENIAVIEKTDIEFNKGFFALTGETGAGKSILIDSINLLLGDRASRDLVRSGCDKAFVSAVFFSDSPVIEKLYDEFGISREDDGSIFLSREISAEGKSVARINSRQVPISVLKVFGRNLIAIHGQQDNGLLLDSVSHLGFLDAFANNAELLADYKTTYSDYKKIKAQLNKIDIDEKEKARKTDLLQFQIDEIETAAPEDGELEALTEKKKLLLNSEKIKDALQYASHILYESEGGVVTLLSELAHSLGKVSDFSSDIEKCYDKAESLYDESESLNDLVNDILENLDFSESELDELEIRLDTLNSLRKKYGNTVAEIYEYLEKAKSELEDIACADENLAKLEKEEKRLFKLLTKKAAVLSESRKKSADLLCKKVAKELEDLEMPKVKLSVSFKEKAFDGTGSDAVEFLICPNLGESLKPLSAIASGGELSRIMLALNSIFVNENSVETMIFDEIDTGVSGRAALKIARKMKEMSKSVQVITVTHLAQIAAHATTHLKIEKTDDGERTYTSVTPLDYDGRVLETARILGGDLASSARETAEDMIKNASSD